MNTEFDRVNRVRIHTARTVSARCKSLCKSVVILISLTVGAIVLPTGSFRESLPLVLSDVECNGNESSILSCTFNTSHIQCDSGEGAAIICQGI